MTSYYNELSELKPKFAPDYCLNFKEDALYAMEDIQKHYNSIIESAGIQKLAVFESTGVFTEANVFESIGNLFKRFFQWVKGLFTKLIDYFRKKRQEAVEKKIAEVKIENLNEEKFKAFKRKIGADQFNSWKALSDKVFGSASAINLDQVSRDVVGDVFNKALSKSNIYDINAMDAACKEIFTTKEVDVDIAYAKANIDEMKKVVVGGKVEKAATASYDAIKKSVDAQITKLNNAKSKDNADETKEALSNCNLLIALCTKFLGYYTQAFKAYYMDTYNTIMRIGKYCTGAVAKKEEGEAKVESLFDWI